MSELMYSQIIAESERELAKQIELVAELRNLPELEGIYWMQPHDSGQVIFAQPYDLEMYKRNIFTLQRVGFEWDGNMQVSPHCGEIISKFTKGRVSIHLHVEPGREGSTCKKSVIGYENTPIYEVVCMDAPNADHL